MERLNLCVLRVWIVIEMTSNNLTLEELKKLIDLKKDAPKEYQQFLIDMEGIYTDLMKVLKTVMAKFED